MVMKSAVDDDDTGWGLGIPEKMKNNANWVDITHEFKGACKGKALFVSEGVFFVCMTILEADIFSSGVFCLSHMQSYTLESYFMTNCELLILIKKKKSKQNNLVGHHKIEIVIYLHTQSLAIFYY